MKYFDSKTTFYLHFGIAFGVVSQLLISLIMHRPYLGRVLPHYQATAFSIHRYLGVFTTVLLLSYWVWVLGFQRLKLRKLFPLGRQQLKQLRVDLKTLLRGRLIVDTTHAVLPGLIQGAGLLLLTAVGLLGCTLFVALPHTETMAPWIHLIKETHKYLSFGVWAFVIGHGGMGVSHLLFQKDQTLGK